MNTKTEETENDFKDFNLFEEIVKSLNEAVECEKNKKKLRS